MVKLIETAMALSVPIALVLLALQQIGEQVADFIVRTTHPKAPKPPQSGDRPLGW